MAAPERSRSINNSSSGSSSGSGSGSKALPADVQAALSRGEFIEAVKLLRGSTGLGLQEAKETIDRMRQRTPVVRPGSSRPVAPASSSERETESYRDGLGSHSPGEVPRTNTRVWLAIVIVAVAYLLWRLLRAAST